MDDCWEWDGARDKDGYGVRTLHGRQFRVHRLAMAEALEADIPDDMCVLHHCDNPPCYRPSHLYLGTHADNARDKVERGRAQNQYTEAEACKYGHTFTPENVYINPSSGNRQCRTCRRRDNVLDKRLARCAPATKRVLRAIFHERIKQDLIFKEQNHPDFFGRYGGPIRNVLRDAAIEECNNANPRTWEHILQEEVMEAFACGDDLVHLRRELIQVAAVCVAWVEAIDRRQRVPTP